MTLEGEATASRQKVFEILRSETELQRVFAMKGKELDDFGKVLEKLSSKDRLFYRSTLERRLEALKQYVKAQREQTFLPQRKALLDCRVALLLAMTTKGSKAFLQGYFTI